VVRRHTKAYLREQRRDMIRILERLHAHWRAESARFHRMVDGLSAILAGRLSELRSAHDILDTFKKWAEEADACLRRDERELQKWRAKRI
jgi:type II secretory pathway component PulM